MQRRHTHGFTLVELMVVVAIVGILTAVAAPAYLEHLAKSRRAEGRNALLRAAQLQERYYSTKAPPVQYALTAELPPLYGRTTGPIYSGDDPASTTGHYTLTVETPTATCPIAACFVMRATPNGRHSPDNKCGSLTYSSSGQRNKIGGTESVDYCWGK